MVEIYLEGLTPRIQDHWKKLGKKPKKRKIELVGEAELKAELTAAREEHDKIAKENAEKEAKEEETKSELKFTKLSAPDATLTLNTGAIISSLAEMRDSLESMDDEIFVQHVSEKKNDLADWIEKSLGMLDISEDIRKLTSPSALVDYLNRVEKKKETIETRPKGPAPPEDSVRAINRLMKEMEEALKAGKKREAFAIHKEINKHYHNLPREMKMRIFKRVTKLSKSLREKASDGKKKSG